MRQYADDEAKEKAKSFEVGYERFAINGKMPGRGDPVRVKQGERVLFHCHQQLHMDFGFMALFKHA